MGKQSVSYIMPSVGAKGRMMDNETLKKMRDRCHDDCIGKPTAWILSLYQKLSSDEDLPDDDDDDERNSQ